MSKLKENVFASDLRGLYGMTRDLALASPEEVESSWNEVKQCCRLERLLKVTSYVKKGTSPKISS